MSKIIKTVGIIVAIITGVTITISTVAGWIVSVGYLLRYGRLFDKAARFTEQELDEELD